MPARSEPRRARRRRALDDDVIAELERAVGARKSTRLVKLLADAAAALESDRLDDARRAVTPVIREASSVAAGRELAGQILYRSGQWRRAVAELEVFRTLRPLDLTCHPVLADSYRALGRHHEVEQLWREVKDASPAPEIMVEARIVMAGSLADRGQLDEAIELLARQGATPKRIRDHHLRQWYALGDLYDRAGAVVEARRWLGQVAARDPSFVDVAERLAALGR
jgi:tetratricopeptide (TPR) repeat protein